jgi:hypothetical protein
MARKSVTSTDLEEALARWNRHADRDRERVRGATARASDGAIEVLAASGEHLVTYERNDRGELELVSFNDDFTMYMRGAYFPRSRGKP